MNDITKEGGDKRSEAGASAGTQSYMQERPWKLDLTSETPSNDLKDAVETENRAARVAVFGVNPPDVYSGGRYSALVLAETISYGGHEVHFVTNHRPMFFDDFVSFPAHDDIELHVTPDFSSNLPEGDFDFVILIPASGLPGFYTRTRIFALERGAHLIFVNFETPNWFNSLSPVPRPESDWSAWKTTCSQAASILSISRESEDWARSFYDKLLPAVRFDHWYPSINSPAADSVPEMEREDRIVLFMRFSSAGHKGSDQMESIFCEAMRGYTVVFILGKEKIPAQTLSKLVEQGMKYGVKLELRHRLSDVEKFTELKRAKLLVFPSYFEGYGYPPVEAQYCGLPCVAFDLPVLREVSGDNILYAKHGDWEDLRLKIQEALSKDWSNVDLRTPIEARVKLGSSTEKINALFDELRTLERFTPQARARLLRRLRFARNYNLDDLPLRWRQFNYRFRLGILKGLVPAVKAIRSLRRTKHRVCYYPAFEDLDALTNQYHRARWYLPFVEGRCESVQLYQCFGGASVGPGPRPDYMAGPPNDSPHISILRGRARNLMMLFGSDLILDWSGQPEGKILKFLDRFCGIKVINVATQDYTCDELGSYCSLIWKHLTSSAEHTGILEEQHDRFRTVAEGIAKKDYVCSCVFGTGPSMDSASDFSYDKTLAIGCDTIIRNEALLDRIQPVFICATDSVNHLGVSICAGEFRRDLLKVLKERDLYFVTTAREGALLLMHYPDIEQKVILIDQTSDGPVYDLVADFGAPRLDGVLNILMLPLAATFSKDIWVLGCDGQSVAGNDEDLWPHAPTAHDRDLVDSARRCHPTFGVLSQMTVYEAFVHSTQMTIETGERERGLRYHSISRSAIPALDSRSVDWNEIDKAGFSGPYRLAELGKIAAIKDIVPRE